MIKDGLDTSQHLGLVGPGPGGTHRATWKIRAIRATRGNQSKLGAILIAVLGRIPKHPPRFGLKATITSDGYVLADFQGKDYVRHHGALVCEVKELVENFRGLADHIKLDTAERAELFAEIRKWIEKDWRAKSTLD